MLNKDERRELHDLALRAARLRGAARRLRLIAMHDLATEHEQKASELEREYDARVKAARR